MVVNIQDLHTDFLRLMRLRKVWDAPGRIIIAAGENPSAAVLQPAAAACIIIMKNDEPTPKEAPWSC